MTDGSPRPARPWLSRAAFGLLLAVVIRQFSPQWSAFAEYNYGWAIPFLCLYLFWERWPQRPSRWRVPSERLRAAGCWYART